MAARDNEQVQIAFGLEIEVRNAARERDHADERQRADHAKHMPVTIEKGETSRFAAPPFGDEIAAVRGEEEPVPILEDVTQCVAAAVRREDFGSLIDDPRWEPLDTRAAGNVWTDDYSNVLATLRFRSQ